MTIGEMSVPEAPTSGFMATVIVPLLPERGYSPLLLNSLFAQTDTRWELILVGSDDELSVLHGVLAKHDERIHLVRSSQADLAGRVSDGAREARGTALMIAPRDAEFGTTVVEKLAERFGQNDVDAVYFDEAIRDGGKNHSVIIAKPDLSPERLRCQFYIGDPIFYRTELFSRLGGLNADIGGAELYDLALRASVLARRIDHIPEVLFVLPSDSAEPGAVRGEAALAATRTVLEWHLQATGGGSVSEVAASGIHRTHRPVIGDPLVSIIIPTRGSYGEVSGETRCLVIEAVRSIIETSTYSNYELVVVMDEVAPPEVVEQLIQIAGDALRIVWWSQPFSFSGKCNFGAFHARGDFLLFLNDDTEVISPRWIEALLSLAQLDRAGMSGAMLYFEDDTIQHAGHLYLNGDAGHIGMNDDRGSLEQFGSFAVEREVSGVTAACAMIPKAVFEEAGGFSMLLPLNFNDVDLCMKVNALGYQIYWTPNAELYHYESKTRVSRVTDYEIAVAWERWDWKLDDSRFWPYQASNLEFRSTRPRVHRD